MSQQSNLQRNFIPLDNGQAARHERVLADRLGGLVQLGLHARRDERLKRLQLGNRLLKLHVQLVELDEGGMMSVLVDAAVDVVDAAQCGGAAASCLQVVGHFALAQTGQRIVFGYLRIFFGIM